jgi:hypothetical protein
MPQDVTIEQLARQRNGETSGYGETDIIVSQNATVSYFVWLNFEFLIKFLPFDGIIDTIFASFDSIPTFSQLISTMF